MSDLGYVPKRKLLIPEIKILLMSMGYKVVEEKQEVFGFWGSLGHGYRVTVTLRERPEEGYYNKNGCPYQHTKSDPSRKAVWNWLLDDILHDVEKYIKEHFPDEDPKWEKQGFTVGTCGENRNERMRRADNRRREAERLNEQA